MPRPNQPRTIASEDTLARRIRHELAMRQMKPATLAAEMTAKGCPVTTSAIYKIISEEEPRRRITVDELVAVSLVLNLQVADLLLPYEVAIEQDLRRMMQTWDEAMGQARAAIATEMGCWDAIVDYVRDRPEVARALEPVISDWALANNPKNPEAAISLRMHTLTGDPAWLDRMPPRPGKGDGDGVDSEEA